jgi:hypothetical protein
LFINSLKKIALSFVADIRAYLLPIGPPPGLFSGLFIVPVGGGGFLPGTIPLGGAAAGGSGTTSTFGASIGGFTFSSAFASMAGFGSSFFASTGTVGSSGRGENVNRSLSPPRLFKTG